MGWPLKKAPSMDWTSLKLLISSSRGLAGSPFWRVKPIRSRKSLESRAIFPMRVIIKQELGFGEWEGWDEWNRMANSQLQIAKAQDGA